LAAVLLAGGMASSYPTVRAADVNDSNVQSMEEEIQKLQNEQDRLLGQINAIKNDKSETAQYKQYMDSLVNATSQKMILAEALVDELDTKIAESETKIKDAEVNIEETQAKIVERLRYAQENGNVNELELLLDSKGMSDFLTRLDKVNSMLEYDRRIMTDFKEQKASLEAYKKTLEASKQTQSDTLTQLEKDKASYEKISKENALYMQSLQNDEDKFWAEYEKARAAEEALNAELTAYIKQMQAQSAVVPSGDGFMRPLPQGVGYISSPYGWRKLNGRDDFHAATDIACAQGTSIYASDGGKVLRAEWHWSYGYYVLVDHGGGLSTLYAHCTSLAVSAGQMVQKGQTVGYVGQTGSAYGYHLHFEVRVNGERVNPAGYVPLG
ncbi:MAG: peptidoglycan DD-metalloendopeptidase family protein, partial [Clostridia bacterium]|nr:peptidoglycan DD-metalloendopeptidase family protein [Clostridia bacterium]